MQSSSLELCIAPEFSTFKVPDQRQFFKETASKSYVVASQFDLVSWLVISSLMAHNGVSLQSGILDAGSSVHSLLWCKVFVECESV